MKPSVVQKERKRKEKKVEDRASQLFPYLRNNCSERLTYPFTAIIIS